VIWALGSVLSFGIAAPILFAVAGSQAGKRSWLVAAGLYAVLSWGGFTLAAATPLDSGLSDIGAAMFLIAWAGASAHAFVVRPEYQRRLAGGADPLERARSIVAKRKEAQKLVVSEPEVARQMGVGRPDVTGAIDMGVVDVNHTAVGAIATLPGVDDALAQEIVRAREECDGFKTLAEMGGILDLEADTVETLRPYVVFLPR
jgi:DNA uptake protein ComE-like DNA-binding protein